MTVQQKLRMLVLLSEMQSILLEGEDDPTAVIASLQAAGIGMMGLVSPSQEGNDASTDLAQHEESQNPPNRYAEAVKNWPLGR